MYDILDDNIQKLRKSTKKPKDNKLPNYKLIKMPIANRSTFYFIFFPTRLFFFWKKNNSPGVSIVVENSFSSCSSHGIIDKKK